MAPLVEREIVHTLRMASQGRPARFAMSNISRMLPLESGAMMKRA